MSHFSLNLHFPAFATVSRILSSKKGQKDYIVTHGNFHDPPAYRCHVLTFLLFNIAIWHIHEKLSRQTGTNFFVLDHHSCWHQWMSKRERKPSLVSIWFLWKYMMPCDELITKPSSSLETFLFNSALLIKRRNIHIGCILQMSRRLIKICNKNFPSGIYI